MSNGHSLLVGSWNLIAQAGLSLALVGLSLVSDTSAQAPLSWNNVLCTPGAECPQSGTPSGACQCGFWTDSPGSTAVNGETVYVFVQCRPDVDDTGAWRAPLPIPDVTHNTFRARAAANDSSILQIIAYAQIGAGTDWATCAKGGAGVVATLQWAGDDNSRYSVKSAVYALGTPIAGLCIILTDDPDNVAPFSQRSTAQVDYIQLEDAGSGNVVTLESFKRPQ
jgi:hypothetical protein